MKERTPARARKGGKNQRHEYETAGTILAAVSIRGARDTSSGHRDCCFPFFAATAVCRNVFVWTSDVTRDVFVSTTLALRFDAVDDDDVEEDGVRATCPP